MSIISKFFEVVAIAFLESLEGSNLLVLLLCDSVTFIRSGNNRAQKDKTVCVAWHCVLIALLFLP